ncbi:MAG: aspartate aminotransferase [Planctomycetes bacterium GWF2_50_10]|nr:MAG: aspartate aminotransferase [Planctomycetes bacterium GWF2_50_10]
MALKAPYLAQSTTCIDASGIRKVFALAATMKDPVNFSIGQPDFDVPDEIKQVAIQAIEKGFNGYSQTAGVDDLLAKINGQVKSEYGWANPASIVTSGVSGSLLLAFMSLIDPGDEVIIPDPYFVMYKHLINMLGGKCVFIDTYPDFLLDPNKLEAAITPKTKLIIANSPANPTGVVYSEAQLKAVADIAARHNIIVLSDEIYEKFCYDGPCPSFAKYHSKTLLMRGFSKSYGMPGWRLGYVSANEELKPLVEQMTMLQQYTFVCAPTPFQKAAVAAMDYDVSHLVNAYRKKRDMIYNGLKGKFELTKPGGAFYAFVKVPSGTATDFVNKAIANNVLVIPGNVFSQQDTHFRISYATKDEKIAQGVEILNRIA